MLLKCIILSKNQKYGLSMYFSSSQKSTLLFYLPSRLFAYLNFCVQIF